MPLGHPELENVVATAVLARANRASLNVRGAFAHILTDLYGFADTAAAGLVILLTGWPRADAVASLFVAALMVKAAWGLLRDAGRILLQAAPDQIANPPATPTTSWRATHDRAHHLSRA